MNDQVRLCAFVAAVLAIWPSLCFATPYAAFVASPTTGPAPLTVSLDARASNGSGARLTKYWWDIDADGTWDIRDNDYGASATYDRPGTYRVRLQVSDEYGSDAVTGYVTINVTNGGRTAGSGSATSNTGSGTPSAGGGFVFVGTSGPAPHTVYVDASMNGRNISYWWDVESDGTWDYRDDDPYTSFTFDRPGRYRLKLIIHHLDGNESTYVAGQDVVVTNPVDNLEKLKLSNPAAYGREFDRIQNERRQHVEDVKAGRAPASNNILSAGLFFKNTNTYPVRVCVNADSGGVGEMRTLDPQESVPWPEDDADGVEIAVQDGTRWEKIPSLGSVGREARDNVLRAMGVEVEKRQWTFTRAQAMKEWDGCFKEAEKFGPAF